MFSVMSVGHSVHKAGGGSHGSVNQLHVILFYRSTTQIKNLVTGRER